MGHPHRIREIAQQAGLSGATVDRVLHGRPGVRSSTVAEVQQAIADLDRQRSQRISAVLHHDLRDDMRGACRLVMQAHGALPGAPHPLPSHVQVITPFDEPRAFTPGE